MIFQKINQLWHQSWRLCALILIFICIYGFLIKIIPWSLVFSPTTINGGDTGSHNYVAWYSHKIFPKLKWWSPDWYAGFPFLYFYPPLLYYLNNLLSFFLPFNVSFKLITLGGTFLLPLTIYFSLYFLDFTFPIPALGAVLSLGYLFLEKFSIYGGNLPSTLAGEFSYSLGFALFFLFIGLLVKNLKTKTLSPFLIILLAIMALVHPFSVIVAVLTGGFLFLLSLMKKEAKQTFWFFVIVYGLAFGLSAFWSLPFLVLNNYTSKMTWTKVINLGEIFPPTLLPFEILALIAIFYAFIKQEKKIIPLILVILAASFPFFFLNHSSIWNTRFLPFILMTMLMLAAYGIGSWLQDLTNFVTKARAFKQDKQIILLICLSLIFTLGFVNIYLPSTITYIPFWLKWNYEGFEKKTSWFQLEELFAYLKTLPEGRIMWEYRGEYDKFGTPRVLENLPLWTNHPTFEGLLIESSLSGYFHFINQAETTKTPTAAIAGMQYPSFNFENGVKHLQLFGARYFVAFTPEIKQLANHYLIKLKEVNDFTIYQVPSSELVSLVPQIELRPKNKYWLEESIDWYKALDFSKFLVFYQNKKELEEIKNYWKPQEITTSSLTIKEIKKDSLVFETENLYQPHLIKISYFPGWQVIGAKGPYLISPSFMMVLPTQKQVILSYHYNIWDKIGMLVSILSFGLLLFLIIRRPFHFLSGQKQKSLTPLN